jgi:transcriptional regulator with XRE-family HTH domain
MPDIHPIITRIVALREAAGVSRASVAKQIHYARQSVGYWEAGRGQPCVDVIDAYARLFGHRLVLGTSEGPIVDALKDARLNAGLRQPDIAPRLGCSVTSLCHWETGVRRLTLARASAYAALFGLALELREVPGA